jgi:hypothetical protein
MFGRRVKPEGGLWINPKPTRSLRERETTAAAGGYEARRVPGHLDEFRIACVGAGRGGDRDAGRTVRIARSREEAERVATELSRRWHKG